MSFKNWKMKLTAILAFVGVLGSLGTYALARSHVDETCADWHGAKGKHGHGLKVPGRHMQAFVKELNLTPEQKTQFEQLKSEMKSRFHQGSRKEMRKQFKETLKTAFLKDTFNASELKQKIETIRTQIAPPTHEIATHLVKAWQILTPSQRTQVEEKLHKMTGRMQTMMALPLADKLVAKGFPPLQRMFTELDLSAEQRTQLQALFQQHWPEAKTKFSQALQLKDQVLTELKRPKPTPENISQVLTKAHSTLTGNLEKHLDVMAQIHTILTPQQRQMVVERMSKHRHHHP